MVMAVIIGRAVLPQGAQVFRPSTTCTPFRQGAVGVRFGAIVLVELRCDISLYSRGERSWGRDRHHRRSEEHTSELQSLMRISYAVFCLKKKKLLNIKMQ